MYRVQSLTAACIIIILGRSVVDAMVAVISLAPFLTVFEKDAAALSFPSAYVPIDIDINLFHNRLEQYLVFTNTAK